MENLVTGVSGFVDGATVSLLRGEQPGGASRRSIGLALRTGLLCGLAIGSTLLGGQMSPAAASEASLLRVATDIPEQRGDTATIGLTDRRTIITIDFVMKLSHPAEAERFVRAVTTPGSPDYHRFLTPNQFADRFASSMADYNAVRDWVVAGGLTLHETSVGRVVVSAEGSVAVISALLNVQFRDYKDHAGRVYIRADDGAALPAAVAGQVSGVVGLNRIADKVPLVRRRLANAGRLLAPDGHGPGGAYNAADLIEAYAIPPQPGTPQSQTIAVFEQGGYTKSDVAKYLHANHLAQVPTRFRSVNGAGNIITSPDVELEAVLDIDSAISMNPALKSVIVYGDGQDPFNTALVDALTAMANDNLAANISISYGQPEDANGHAQFHAENALFMQLAAQGVQVFVSSGDAGAYESYTKHPLGVADPASQPHVTSVGGTTLITSSRQVYPTYENEYVWNTIPSDFSASGGGVSAVWPIPAYQMLTGSSVATANGGSATMRNVPDVAAVADPDTGLGVYSAVNGGWVQVGGTSLSAPLWAGFASIVSATSEGLGLGRAGEFNPRMYQYEAVEGPLGSSHVNDVISGTNGDAQYYRVPGFNAGPGYDNTTGFGSMFGTALALDLALPTGTQGPKFPAHLDVRPAATSVTYTWNPSVGATGYLVSLYTTNNLSIVHLFESETAGGSSNKLTISGLAPATNYAWVFYAISPSGSTSQGFYIFTTMK